jgi:hypothetical protein
VAREERKGAEAGDTGTAKTAPMLSKHGTVEMAEGRQQEGGPKAAERWGTRTRT